jgi:hypothetical protein
VFNPWLNSFPDFKSVTLIMNYAKDLMQNGFFWIPVFMGMTSPRLSFQPQLSLR